MDGNICNERGHHEFQPKLKTLQLLKHVECIDCEMRAIEYLGWGWVHPEISTEPSSSAIKEAMSKSS